MFFVVISIPLAWLRSQLAIVHERRAIIENRRYYVIPFEFERRVEPAEAAFRHSIPRIRELLGDVRIDTLKIPKSASDEEFNRIAKLFSEAFVMHSDPPFPR